MTGKTCMLSSSRLLLHRRGKDCKARGWCHWRYLSSRTFLPCRFISSFSLPQWWIQQCNRSGIGSLQPQCGLGKLEANPVVFFCLHPGIAVDTTNYYKHSVFSLGQRKDSWLCFFSFLLFLWCHTENTIHPHSTQVKWGCSSDTKRAINPISSLFCLPPTGVMWGYWDSGWSGFEKLAGWISPVIPRGLAE